MKWSLLPTLSAPMPFQMAVDDLLGRNCSESLILRFYYSSEAWISVGYSWNKSKNYNETEVLRQNRRLPVCRRLTGGGTVLHGRDLMFSLISRGSAAPKCLGPVRDSYRKIHESVKMAFAKSGFPVCFYQRNDPLPKGHDCFHFPVVSDLAWKGRKVAGGAQKRTKDLVIHQESLCLPEGIREETLIREMIRAFELVFKISITPLDLEPGILYQAICLAKERYAL